jgi:beta-glucosidase
MMRIIKPSSLALVAFLAILPVAACSGRKDGGKGAGAQVDKNALYKKADAPVADRVEDLLKRMTLDEKIGQMTQLEKGSARPGTVREFFLGSVLSGGGGSPNPNMADAWADMVDAFQDEALQTRLGIPIIYGVDAVHGHGNLRGATVFPHNIALGATGDADLVRRIGEATAIETAATGIPWNFGPCVAVARDPRWGRFYESFSQDPLVVTALGTAYIEGYQGADVGGVKPAACAKHFLGDGATAWGSSKTAQYKLDQGDVRGDDKFLREVLLPPYAQAVKAGVKTVMVSFSSWNGVKMHGQKALVTDLLKGELGFSGFVVSDWAGIEQVDRDYYKAIVAGINAGIDMNMAPYDAPEFIRTVKDAVAAKDIPMERIDDAVRRILRVKFEMGLFEHPKANLGLIAKVRSPGHLALAREAAGKSLVVLKNDAGTLPIAKSAGVLYVAGNAANDIGVQCGGWTIAWQGVTGPVTEGTTILSGLKESLPGTEVAYSKDASFEGVGRDAVCVVVLGEKPYAEGVGDSETLSLGTEAADTFARARAAFSRVILVVVSGRPVVLDATELKADAIVAAWLPGTEGSGVADVLTGARKPTGKLSFAWPASVSQLPLGRFIDGSQKPLWPVGYGLSY